MMAKNDKDDIQTGPNAVIVDWQLGTETELVTMTATAEHESITLNANANMLK